MAPSLNRSTAPKAPWRPPTHGSRQVHTRRLVTAVVASLVICGLALWGFASLASNGTKNMRLGDQVFPVGNSDQFAKRVTKEGPLFFNDLVRDDTTRRPLVLTYLGGKDWAALNALPPDSTDEKCVVRFEKTTNDLVDPCTNEHYSLAGIGSTKRLERFVSEVNRKGLLTIDLNQLYPEKLR